MKRRKKHGGCNEGRKCDLMCPQCGSDLEHRCDFCGTATLDEEREDSEEE